jgi:hypothetical protein
VQQVTHGDASRTQTVDRYEVDPATQMARPSSITFSGWGGCAGPVPVVNTVTVPPVQNGQTTTLRADADVVTGADLHYQWYRGVTVIPGATEAALITDRVTTEYDQLYVLHAYNACGRVQIAYHVSAFAVPSAMSSIAAQALTAVAYGATAIDVSWSSVASIHHYRLLRSSAGGAPAILSDSLQGTTFHDTSVAQNTTYIYQVASVDAQGNVSTLSNPDYASTKAFTAITTASTISAAHFDELLAAVNMIRAAAALPALSWTSILSSGSTSVAAGNRIRAEHLTALRRRMDEAIASIGGAPTPYSDPTIAAGSPVIKLNHVTELRGRTQ